MKTAVLFTGHMRTFRHCLPTIRWQVLRHYENPTFYVSTINDADAESWKLLERMFPGAPVYVEVVEKQPQLPMPAGVPDEAKWVNGACFTHEPYAISVSPQAVLRQLWQLNETWKLYRRSGDFGHDTFLRIRPDLWLHSFQGPIKPLSIIAHTPWWGRFGGINDRFAVLGTRAAEAYFTTFERVPELIADGCPFHPESLVKASIEKAGCHVSDFLPVEFSTLRGNGESRAPEISPIDFVHACANRNS